MQSNGIEGRVYERDRSGSTDSMDSTSKPPLVPSGSTMSLGSRPPLIWLFNHIRQEGKTSLSKEDMQKLVGPQVDPVQLDLAFENLDADGDGVVSMDEFIAGFTRFWRETPDTPSNSLSLKPDFSFSSPVRTGRKRLPSEEQYEYLGEDTSIKEEVGPDEEFQRTLCVLSSHNRCVIIMYVWLSGHCVMYVRVDTAWSSYGGPSRKPTQSSSLILKSLCQRWPQRWREPRELSSECWE